MGEFLKGAVAIGTKCADEVKAAAGIAIVPVGPIAFVADVILTKASFFSALTPTAIAILWFVNSLLAILILTAVFLPSSEGFFAFQKAVYGKDAAKETSNTFKLISHGED